MRIQRILACVAILIAPIRVACTTQTMCEQDTIKILRNSDVRKAAKQFLDTFTETCNAGTSLNLCEKPRYDPTKMEKCITRIIDYRALRNTQVVRDFVHECQSSNQQPVLVYETVRFLGNDGGMCSEVKGIELAHCVPRACAKNRDDVANAYYAFQGQSRENRHVHFQLIDDRSLNDIQSQDVGDCVPADATWPKWKGPLKKTFNAMIGQINLDCSSSNPADYCATFYRSLGTFSAQKLRLSKLQDTDEFQAYADACENAGGHLCTFDMVLGFVGSRPNTKNWWKSDRGEVSHEFLGYPECLAKNCGHGQAMEIAGRYVEQLKDKMSKPTKRLLREVDPRQAIHVLSEGMLNVTIDEVMLDVMSFDNEDVSDSTSDEKNSKIDENLLTYSSTSFEQLVEEDHPPRIEAHYAAIDESIYTYISEGSTMDYIQRENDENTSRRKLSYSTFEGREACGTAANMCSTGLYNLFVMRKQET